MSTRLIQRLVLVLILVLSSYGFHSARAQGNSTNKVFLPLLRGTPPNITGSWIGFLFQPEPRRSFEFELNLTQNGNTIQGTSTAREESYFAFWNLTGTANGGLFVLNEINITSSNPRPGTRWCIKQMNLVYSSSFDIPTLSGNWDDPGCNSGQLYLQPKNGPFLSIGGTWKGTITSGTTEYALEISMQQNNSLITGTSSISRGNDVGRLSLGGYIAGSNIRIEERTVLETSGANWCVKTMAATYKIINNVPTIEGSWTAPNCVPGNLILTKQ